MEKTLMMRPGFVPNQTKKIELDCHRTISVPSEYTDNYTWEIAFEAHLTEVRKQEQAELEKKFSRPQVYDHSRYPTGGSENDTQTDNGH
jgi:hypothetical protein